VSFDIVILCLTCHNYLTQSDLANASARFVLIDASRTVHMDYVNFSVLCAEHSFLASLVLQRKVPNVVCINAILNFVVKQYRANDICIIYSRGS
jgi:hypothetical protein